MQLERGMIIKPPYHHAQFEVVAVTGEKAQLRGVANGVTYYASRAARWILVGSKKLNQEATQLNIF